MENESKLYPIENLKEIAFSVIIVVALTLLKGAATIPSILGIDYCGYGFHLINIVIFAIGYYNV